MNEFFNQIAALLTKVTTVMKDHLLKWQRLFLSDEPEEVTVKQLNEYDEVVDTHVKNLAMIKAEFEEWKEEVQPSIANLEDHINRLSSGKVITELKDPYSEHGYLTYNSSAGTNWIKRYRIDNSLNTIVDGMSSSNISVETINSEGSVDVLGFRDVMPFPRVDDIPNRIPLKKLKGSIFHNGGQVTDFEINPGGTQFAKSTVTYNSHGDSTPYLTDIVIVKVGSKYSVMLKPLQGFEGFYGEMLF